MLSNPISDLAYYLQVSESEERVLKLLQEQPGLTLKEISAKANCKSETTLSKNLQEMRRAGYVHRDYNDQYARWSLNPDHYAAVLLSPPAQSCLVA